MSKRSQPRYPSPPCAYCGKPSNHKDHVVPQSLFSARDDKKQMITVRACPACKLQKDPLDSFLRDLLATDFRTERHPNAFGKFWGELRRSAMSGQSELSRIVATQAEFGDLISPAGVIVPGFSAPIDPYIDYELKFIARGLTRYHHRDWTVAQDADIRTGLLGDVSTSEVWRIMERQGGISGPHVRGNEVFRWAYQYSDADHSIWLMRFWGGLYALVTIQPADTELVTEAESPPLPNLLPAPCQP